MNSSGGPFSNAARNLRKLGSSPACWIWVALVAGIQLLVTAMGGQDLLPARAWFETFGLCRQEVLAGKVWQIFTYGFLHGGWLHVGLNSLFLLLVGSRIEHMTGHAIMVRATLLGVLGGGIGHLILAPSGSGAPLLVGLSGGCMALLLLLTTLSPQSRMMPIPLSGKSLGLGILTTELLFALADPQLGLPGISALGNWLASHGMRSGFQLGHACHFGGGLAGWLLGKWLLRPRITLKRLRRDRERREASESERT